MPFQRLALSTLALWMIGVPVAAGEPAEPQAIHLSLSDAAHMHLDDGGGCESIFSSRLSHDPAHPREPLLERLGEIDRGRCSRERYCRPDCERAGNPHAVAPWAKCSVTPKYSAWFVGGDTAWILPFQHGHATRTTGTWGLDYDGLFHPRRVWLLSSRDRQQGGTGAYSTDGEPAVISRFKQRHGNR